MAVASIGTIPAQELGGQAVVVWIDAEDEMNCVIRCLPSLCLRKPTRAWSSRLIAARAARPLASMPSGPSWLNARPPGWQARRVERRSRLRAVSRLGEGEIMMLENLAFEPGEEAGDHGAGGRH